MMWATFTALSANQNKPEEVRLVLMTNSAVTVKMVVVLYLCLSALIKHWKACVSFLCIKKVVMWICLLMTWVPFTQEEVVIATDCIFLGQQKLFTYQEKKLQSVLILLQFLQIFKSSQSSVQHRINVVIVLSSKPCYTESLSVILLFKIPSSAPTHMAGKMSWHQIAKWLKQEENWSQPAICLLQYSHQPASFGNKFSSLTCNLN